MSEINAMPKFIQLYLIFSLFFVLSLLFAVGIYTFIYEIKKGHIPIVGVSITSISCPLLYKIVKALYLDLKGGRDEQLEVDK